MVGYVRSVVSAWLLLDYHCLAYLIDCNTQNCHDTVINCPPHGPCSISCSSAQSCTQSIINCPQNGDCSIYCDGEYSCQSTVINATTSIAGDFNLLCEQSTTVCTNMSIYGSTSNANHGAFNVLCNGESNACSHSQINCGKSSNCLISCNAVASCQYAIIHSPDQKNVLTHCNGDHSCIGTMYDASNALTLSVTGCSHDDSCSDVSLYCPPHTNGVKHCFITGHTTREWSIYAVNGWQDINNLNLYHKGTMFCGHHYNASCHVTSNEWLCTNSTTTNDCGLTRFIPTFDGTLDMNLGASEQITIMAVMHSPFGNRLLFGIVVVAVVFMIGTCCYCRKPAHNKTDKLSKKEWERLSSEPIPQVMSDDDATITVIRQITEENIKEIEGDSYTTNTVLMHSKRFNSMHVECQSLDDGTLDLNTFHLGAMTPMELNPIHPHKNTRHARKAPIMKPYSSPTVSLCILEEQNNDEKDDTQTNMMQESSALSIVYSSEDEAMNGGESLPSQSLVNTLNIVSRIRANGHAMYHHRKATPTVESIECKYVRTQLEDSETDVSSESLVGSTDERDATPTVQTATSVYVGTGSFGHSFIDPAPSAC
eukprot:180321_1